VKTPATGSYTQRQDRALTALGLASPETPEKRYLLLTLILNQPRGETPSDASKTPNPEQGDLFLCEIANWPVKDDVASMEVPLFSLSKNKDLKIRTFKRGNKSVNIIPSSVGAATVFDKDLLIYIASQIVEQLNLNKARGDNKPVSRTVQIESIDFLHGTSRGDGRRSF
jgi:hypothetical protein